MSQSQKHPPWRRWLLRAGGVLLLAVVRWVGYLNALITDMGLDIPDPNKGRLYT